MCHNNTFFWNSIFQTHRVLLQKLKPCFAYQNSISNLGCCLGFNKRTDHKRFRNNKTPLGQTPPLRGVGGSIWDRAQGGTGPGTGNARFRVGASLGFE